MNRVKFTLLALLAAMLLLLTSCGQHDPFSNSFADGSGDYPSGSGGDGSVLGSCMGTERGQRACVEVFDLNGWTASAASESCAQNNGAWSAGSACPAWYIDVDYSIDGSGVIYYYPPPVQLPGDAALLAAGELTEGSIAELEGEAWYKFEATAGASYYLLWNDFYSGATSNYMADVTVDAYNGSGDLIFHGDDEDNSPYPGIIAVESSGLVYVRVMKTSERGGDKFSVVYNGGSGYVHSSSSNANTNAGPMYYVPETKIPPSPSNQEVVNIYSFSTRNGKVIDVHYRFPRNNEGNPKILIALHGDGNVGDLSSMPKNISDRENIILIMPNFYTNGAFTSTQYGQLDIASNINNPENWTSKIIDDLFLDFKQRFSLPNSKYILYGYSQGGIAAQKIAMFSDSPYMEYSISAGSGGYLTSPDDQRNFNQGIKNLPMHKDLIDRNFGRKMYLLTGNKDIMADYSGIQGKNRHMRALYFYSFSKDYCERNGLNFNVELVVMDGVAHEIAKSLPFAIDIVKGIYDAKREVHGPWSLDEHLVFNHSGCDDESSPSGGGNFSYGQLPYEGQTYKTIAIGTQTWMAENLNYNAEGSQCYNNVDSNCVKYGRFYDWATAMTVCPSGWRLPSTGDWDILFNYVQVDNCGTYSARSDASMAGKYLKATDGWNWDSSFGRSGNGEDKYGFAALPSGSIFNGSFGNLGNRSYWWTSSDSGEKAYLSGMSYGFDDSSYYYLVKTHKLSVRCVKE